MDERPEQRPEGRLIAVAQKRMRLSNRKAAKLAGLSEGHWRALVSGSRSISTGVWVPVNAPAETLGRMAQVVGVTSKQLRSVGRADAAEALEDLELDDLAEDEEDDLLSPETLRLIERLRTDPEMRRRFFDAVLAGHGQPRRTTEHQDEENPGRSA